MMPDPVVDAGRLLAALNRKLDEEQTSGLKLAAQNGERLRLLEDCLLDLMKETAEEIGAAQASTLEGAMVQVMLAMADADTLATWAPDRIQEMFLPRIERCLYSVLAVLVGLSGADPVSLGAEVHMPARSNPWKTAQAA